jgi:hypothetical protein
MAEIQGLLQIVFQSAVNTPTPLSPQEAVMRRKV